VRASEGVESKGRGERGGMSESPGTRQDARTPLMVRSALGSWMRWP